MVGLLTSALQQCALGVPLPGHGGPPRKDKSLACLGLSAHLAVAMRGRGGGELLAARAPLVQALCKFAAVAVKLQGKLAW